MTKKEKIRILKAMRKHMMGHEVGFLCESCATVKPLPKPDNDRLYDPIAAEAGLIELGFNKPNLRVGQTVWFDTLSTKPRIKAIDEVLKRLQK